MKRSVLSGAGRAPPGGQLTCTGTAPFRGAEARTNRLDPEARRTIKTLATQGATNSHIARLLGVTEGAIRHHVARLQAGAFDGRSRQEPKAACVAAVIDHWRQMQGDTPINLAVLHAWLVSEHGYSGTLRSIQRYWARTYPAPAVQAWRAAFEWMRAVLQKEISPDALRREVGDIPDFPVLLHRLYDGRLSDRNRSMVAFASRRGLSGSVVCAFLGIQKTTQRKYLRVFEAGGQAALFARQTKSTRKFDNEVFKQAVFGVLHEPPSNYGINRTTWIMPDLSRVLREKGRPVSPQVIRKITKAAGYRWRKARIVLTSADPDYTEKLDHIRSILSKLRPDEAFFSIDEFGPFAVKMQPGRALSAPGEQHVVPQRQKSRGCMIVTAALELSGNQVTHFYSSKKNTAEMIRMMELLVEKYHDRRKLYLSWDAASWHISKRLGQRIEEHNAAVLSGGGPTVETAPLPSGAQFLNVIKSVFSGMARAIIHNSDYKTLDDAKAAVDRYFADRNAHFLQNPKRAGRKIWGKEREVAAFSESNNCKDPRYR
jgi:transposase